MSFEKTNQLITKLNQHNLEGKLMVRLGGINNAELVIHSIDKNYLKSISDGIESAYGRRPRIWELHNGSSELIGYNMRISTECLKVLCEKLKVNLNEVKQELQKQQKYENITSEDIKLRFSR